jgi:hypothetical protein
MKKINKSLTKNTILKTNQKPKKIGIRSKTTIFGIMGIGFLAIFSFQSVVDNYVGMGLAAVPSYIFSIIFYLTPFALIISELSSFKKCEKSESGLNGQVKLS